MGKPKSFVLVGPGKVGTAVAYLLKERGYTLLSVLGRSDLSLERARLFLGQQVPYAQDFIENISAADFLLLGVQDDQVINLVGGLQQTGLLKPGQTLIHFSGVLPADTGNNSEMVGIGRLSLHPLQSIPSVEAGIKTLGQAVWSLEGDSQSRALGEEILTDLQVDWMRLSADDKPLYHAAACIVANYLVTLVYAGMKIFQDLGFTTDLAQKALWPLIRGTVTNLEQMRPEVALTGPLARGDGETIKKHMTALKKTDSEWLSLYQVLGEATLKYLTLEEKDCRYLTQILKGGMEDGENYCNQIKGDEA